jgi:hypothetical protein
MTVQKVGPAQESDGAPAAGMPVVPADDHVVPLKRNTLPCSSTARQNDVVGQSTAPIDVPLATAIGPDQFDFDGVVVLDSVVDGAWVAALLVAVDFVAVEEEQPASRTMITTVIRIDPVETFLRRLRAAGSSNPRTPMRILRP